MGRLILVLGGTKSGKTSFVQNRAKELQRISRDGEVLYIATARVLDEEMKVRVARHIADRPASWKTWEKPTRLHEGLEDMSEGCCALLLDCLTMLATNIISDLGEEPSLTEATRALFEEIDRIIEIIPRLPGELLVVSNQVEAGLVSPYRLGRLFQDLMGMTHQRIAAAADEVYLMTAGIPQRIK